MYVFLDWQNVYMRAREAFHSLSDPVVKGQVDPVDLGHVLTADYARRHPDDDFELERICIYRGAPTQQHDAKGYAAVRRQSAAWRTNRKVDLHLSDLRYPLDWGSEGCVDKPREKGVDVALALDVVTLGLEGMYDVGIVMSADYDLKPALDYMVRRRISRGEPDIEVAAWKGDDGSKPLRIRLDNRPLYCIWLDRQAYWGVMDERDYNVAATKDGLRATVPRPGSWLPR
ncbi:NYN domain-containing protein [Cellulomonas sp. ES6]|uniref:NYN domain-containing protein n=1 Tax=Cellulomonas sp. ES6 TaxID=3039384 RepID=UPI0024B65085|nr:NYN domain-containing protein [Cellulomonas sp. ES6]WHP16313.1 NYN domain-containing protein [Cellulomonas sp. ES6]